MFDMFGPDSLFHPKARRRRPLAVALLLLLAAGLAGCRGDAKATLSDLTGVEQLKARFNHDAGKPRIILLLSPT